MSLGDITISESRKATNGRQHSKPIEVYMYEPTVMFFGMCNSPATFQAMMDRTFEDIIEKGFVLTVRDKTVSMVLHLLLMTS